jgi:hypothetical protein
MRRGVLDGRVKPGHDEVGVWAPDLALRQAQGEVLKGSAAPEVKA